MLQAETYAILLENRRSRTLGVATGHMNGNILATSHSNAMTTTSVTHSTNSKRVRGAYNAIRGFEHNRPHASRTRGIQFFSGFFELPTLGTLESLQLY
ncbi:hypothetical protein AND_009764 [Anopheles darlingi]|uniref:Uncharacterized protein n=1 Tax=Anopheles darlingi TaxID=43151 RepID=W5J7A2_ANODA|nr:hypothetical protein AND_009764 [Anopheles darlingi]